MQIENNILDVSSGGYAIQVAQNSEQGFKSDYNLFMLSNGSQVAYWENQSFASQTNWYYEVGFDQHSQMGNADFVNLSADANGAIGWDTAQVAGSAVSVNTACSHLQPERQLELRRTSGRRRHRAQITATLGGPSPATLGNATQSAEGQASATTASWTFNGLTPGDYYEIEVTWQQPYYITVNGTSGYVDEQHGLHRPMTARRWWARRSSTERTITPGTGAGDFADANGV